MPIRNILIVNNDSHCELPLETDLAKLGYTIIGNTNRFQNALDIIKTNHVELIIIDLDELKKGIEFAIKVSSIPLPIIVITSQDTYEVYQQIAVIDRLQYLVKPFHIHTLDSSIRLLSQQPTQEPQFIRGNSKGEFIAIKDILYLEVEHTYTFIQTTTRRYAFKKSLTQFKLLLPMNRFLQIHRSFLVQKKYILKIDPERQIVDLEGHTLPMSRRMKHNIFSKDLDTIY